MAGVTFKTNVELSHVLAAAKVLGITPTRIAYDTGENDYRKPYKERDYQVSIGPTTQAVAEEIVVALRAGFLTMRQNMVLKSTDIKRIDGTYAVICKVWYGARGNCPADARGVVKKMLKGVFDDYIEVEDWDQIAVA